MATQFSIKIRGVQKVQRKLLELAALNHRAALSALSSEAEIELTEMKNRTPVDTGTLRASGRIEPVGALGIKWIFGGAAIDYAVSVHENLDVFHNPGQSKYVESVVMEFIPNATERIGRRFAKELGI